jgi:hypothetical protein
MNPRVFRWWQAAEEMAGRLTTPHCDVAGADAVAHEMIQSSRIFAIADAVNRTVARAWQDSAVRRLSESVERTWLGRPRLDRLRLVGRIISAASVTVLVLQSVESPQGAPFRWMLPLALGVGGLLAELGAAPILRTRERRRG